MSRDVPGCALRGAAALPLPDAGSEQAALDAVLDALAPLFERAPLVDGERAGALLVVSDDAGSGTAAQFWRDALEVGPALASPGAFPWCLANAPCATLARRFAVTGPNVTWLSARADASDLFDAPSDWLADHLLAARSAGFAACGWIVALHAGDGARLMAWHWEADPGDPAAVTDPRAVDAAAAGMRARMAHGWAAFAV